MMFCKGFDRHGLLAGSLLILTVSAGAAETGSEAALTRKGIRKGVCVVVGLPKDGAGLVTDLAKGSELLIYFQSPDENEVMTVRRAAEEAGLLGKRIFADRGDWNSIHLADNLASEMWTSSSALESTKLAREEIRRVLKPCPATSTCSPPLPIWPGRKFRTTA